MVSLNTSDRFEVDAFVAHAEAASRSGGIAFNVVDIVLPYEVGELS